MAKRIRNRIKRIVLGSVSKAEDERDLYRAIAERMRDMTAEQQTNYLNGLSRSERNIFYNYAENLGDNVDLGIEDRRVEGAGQ